MQAKFFFSILCITVPFHLWPSDVIILSNWQTHRESQDIRLDYRWVKIGDTLETRQMRATFTVQSSISKILENFTDPVKLSQWAAGARETKVLDLKETSWKSYTLFDVPWPFSRQDLITLNEILKTDNETRINLTSTPESLPLVPGVKRLEHYNGYWIFIPIGNNSHKVEFCSISFSKPLITRRLQDPVLQKILISSFVKFRTLSEL
jgi:hypothetical protein